MRLTHFSKDYNFVPTAIESVEDFGRGCFFYARMDEEALQGQARGWADRLRFDYEAPDEIVEIIQSFEPGEAANEHLIVEVFVRADDGNSIKKTGN